MRMPLPDWMALALFAAMVLAVALFGLAASAHFPAASRRPSLCGAAGSAILWGTVATTLAATAQAVRLAIDVLPVYAAVIAAGAALLSAPLLLKPLPDTLIDDRAGLILFAALSAVLAAVSTQL